MFPQLLPFFFFEDYLLVNLKVIDSAMPEGHWLGWLANKFQRSTYLPWPHDWSSLINQDFRHTAPCPAFYIDSRDSNLGPYACLHSRCITESSCQPHVILLCLDFQESEIPKKSRTENRTQQRKNKENLYNYIYTFIRFSWGVSWGQYTFMCIEDREQAAKLKLFISFHHVGSSDQTQDIHYTQQ